MQLATELLREKHTNETTKTTQRVKQYQDEYNNIKKRLDNLTAMRLDGEISREEAMPVKSQLLADQARVNSLLADSEDSSNNWLKYAENFVDTVTSAKSLAETGTLEEKKDFLIYVCSNLILTEGKIVFTPRKPYNLLPSLNRGTKWWAVQESNL